jgi:hypothetical protein
LHRSGQDGREDAAAEYNGWVAGWNGVSRALRLSTQLQHHAASRSRSIMLLSTQPQHHAALATQPQHHAALHRLQGLTRAARPQGALDAFRHARLSVELAVQVTRALSLAMG